jgi:hypothetical protein
MISPIQRFGLVVVAGAVVNNLANIFLFPLFGGAEWKRQPKSATVEA